MTPAGSGPPAPGRPRHALVTGGAGFIGHHLVNALLARGMSVTVLDDLSMGKRENVPAAARFVEGDVRDVDLVESALEGVDCVFHEAAIVSIRASVEEFARDADVNLMGTLAVLRAMGRVARRADGGVRKAVLASSMAVYADSAAPVPLSEEAPTRPISPYGIAKLAAEDYWLMMAPSFGVEPTVLRYFNTYGPGQTLTPYVGVITIFINKLLAGEAPVVFGDGEQRRDFVHVSDIVSANLAVLDGPDTDAGADAGAGAARRVFNVGTGRATSVNEIAAHLIERLAPGMRAGRAPAQAGEMRNAIAGVDAIRTALGWSAARTTLDLGDVIAAWSGGGGVG